MCAIARGIMAALLMIDELSLGLAPKVVDHLGAALRQIMTEGLSLLLVEQDVGTAFELTSRGIVVDSGRVKLSGPTEALSVNPMVQQTYMGIVRGGPATSRRPSIEHRDAIDLDVDAFAVLRAANAGARHPVVLEITAKHFVEAREIRDVAQDHPHVDDVGERGATGL